MEVGGSITIFHYYGNADTRVWAINENRKWNGQIKLIPTKKKSQWLTYSSCEAINTYRP